MRKRTGFFLFAAVVIFAGCGIIGGSKDVSAPESSRGLDYVPYYKRGEMDFSGSSAIDGYETRKKEAAARKDEIQVEAAKKVELIGQPTFDPWIPPVKKDPSELPEALRGAPKDKFGYLDWTAMVQAGLIKPRDGISPEVPQGDLYDMDIVFQINDRLMADVGFSHKIHTYWLDCSNCHPSIFKEKKGANKFTMYDVWNGQYCGRCHGKVAFQPKGFENCERCHNAGKLKRL